MGGKDGIVRLLDVVDFGRGTEGKVKECPGEVLIAYFLNFEMVLF
jgi:hypothetical protein